MKQTKLKFLTAIFLIETLFFHVESEVFFNGETGIQTSISESKTTEKMGMFINGFLTGQLSFSDRLFARTELSVKTSDIFDSGIFKDTESALCLNEISLNYIFPSVTNKTHFFSVFVGNADPIGTDRFLRHQFGLKKLASPLMESYVGADGAAIYPLSGIGGSYTVRFGSIPLSLGLYIYKNDENENDDSQPNFDIRMATSNKNFTMDFAFGAGIPFSRENENGEKVVLYINKIYIHSGLTALIGNSDSNSFFMQAGFSHLEFSSSDDIKSLNAENIFLLLEPRFKTKSGGINVTIFNIPENILAGTINKSTPNSLHYEKFIFLKESLGINFMIYANSIHLMNRDITIGLHTMLAFKDSYISDIVDFKSLMGNKVLKISPFMSMPLINGDFMTTLQFKPTEFDDSIRKSIQFSVGYKKNI